MITTRDSRATEEAGAVLPKLPATLDTQGRLRVSREQRRGILAALARSGESVPGFARRAGLKYSTLARWVQHDRRAKRPKGQPQLRWLEAVVETTQGNGSGSSLLLQLPGGVRVEVTDEKQATLAAKLVQALAQPC